MKTLLLLIVLLGGGDVPPTVGWISPADIEAGYWYGPSITP